MKRLEMIIEDLEEEFSYLNKEQINKIAEYIANECWCTNCECNAPHFPWDD